MPGDTFCVFDRCRAPDWVRSGPESVSSFPGEKRIVDDTLVDLLKDSNYVKVGMIRDEIDLVERLFFDFTLCEAEILAPPSCVFRNGTWEDVGYMVLDLNKRRTNRFVALGLLQAVRSVRQGEDRAMRRWAWM
jgi:hypothetical protein